MAGESAKKVKSKSRHNLQRVQLECTVAQAYIRLEWREWDECKALFKEAHAMSKALQEKGFAEMCLCNQGVASASVAFDTGIGEATNEFMRNTFYKTASMGFGGAAQTTFGQGFVTSGFGQPKPPTELHVEQEGEDSDSEEAVEAYAYE